jgi:hypothetical protein
MNCKIIKKPVQTFDDEKTFEKLSASIGKWLSLPTLPTVSGAPLFMIAELKFVNICTSLTK